MKMKVNAFVLWEKNGSHICSSIYDLRRENWLVKQLIWILGISKVTEKPYFSSLVSEPY